MNRETNQLWWYRMNWCGRKGALQRNAIVTQELSWRVMQSWRVHSRSLRFISHAVRPSPTLTDQILKSDWHKPNLHPSAQPVGRTLVLSIHPWPLSLSIWRIVEPAIRTSLLYRSNLAYVIDLLNLVYWAESTYWSINLCISLNLVSIHPIHLCAWYIHAMYLFI